jgi:16S rRNA (guanine527-N7)-methyltransferase
MLPVGASFSWAGRPSVQSDSCWCMLIRCWSLVVMLALSCRSFRLRPAAMKTVLTQRELSIQSSNFIYAQQQLKMYQASFPSITEGQLQQLAQFCDELMYWNEKVNLISRKDIANVVERHVVPALAMSFVHDFTQTKKVIDVGTGGGFPGVPLAIISPNTQFTLLDSSSKKTNVVGAIVKALKLQNVNVITCRAEEHIGKKYDLIVGRAVTSLPQFMAWTSRLLRRDARRGNDGILYLNGGDISKEAEALCLHKHTIHPISELVTELETDKYVLRIPVSDVSPTGSEGMARKYYLRKFLKPATATETTKKVWRGNNARARAPSYGDAATK